MYLEIYTAVFSTQRKYAIVVRKWDNITNDYISCRAYVNESVGILFSWSYKDPLKNFYSCELEDEKEYVPH